MKKFRCKVCGYIHESDNLADDYICPLCGLGIDYFEKISEVEQVIDNELATEVVDNRVLIDIDNPSIARIVDKCINCGRCKTVCEDGVGIKYDINKTKCAVCINCGQCILNCPVGALVPKYQYKRVMKEIQDDSKVVVFFTSPAVRVALGEEFGMEAGSFVEGKMVSAIREVGANYVFDTTFGADLTIMEEASELVSRIKGNGKLPQFTSCCPAWVKYMEIYYPELLGHISTSKSPISMQGAMIKTYFAKKNGIDPNNIVTVALTPCTAKKFEITREELSDATNGEKADTDYVITTSEFAVMLRENNIEFMSLSDSSYDTVFGKGSGAGVIFGNTGGVMEAALRTAYYLVMGKNPEDEFLKYESLRGLEGARKATVQIGPVTLRVLVIHEIPKVLPLLEQLKETGDIPYDFIEIMNCRGGCIGGGGQPLTPIAKMDEVRRIRINGLYQNDDKMKLRTSHENPDIIKIYDEFLNHPGSEIAEKLLHTSYEDKSKLLKERDSFDI